MKQITSLFLFAFSIATVNLSAQTIVQSEDFTTYDGTTTTVPAGWVFSYNGNYTSTASSGTSGPNSYKFGVNNARITSPMFVAADTLSFWIKGNGTDTISTFSVLQSADNITWDTIAKLVPIPTTTTGQTYKFPVAIISHYIGFHYFKSIGNVAFDDYRLLQYGPTSIADETSISFDLSPNPGTGLFVMNLDKSTKAHVTVYNITGKKILEKEVTLGNQTLDLTAQPNGSYFVIINTGKEVITKKIIINN